MKRIIVVFLLCLAVGCTDNKQANVDKSLNVGDSITTIDGVSYYWLQMSDDSARISVVKNDSVIEECLVTGPVYGAVPADEAPFRDRFIFILCGEDQYELFDTKHIPSEINLLDEEELEQCLEEEEADLVIDLQ